jgi:polyisoprenoid-binding protein YceI
MRWPGFISLTAVLVSHAGAALAAPSEWTFDGPHTAAHFVVKHLLIATVRGSFSHVEGRVVIDDEDVSRCSVTAAIHADSLYTGSWARDQVLRGEHFLALTRYPRILFRSTGVARAPRGDLLVSGVLTIRGRSRPVTLEVRGPTAAVRDRSGRAVRALVARARFDRKAFGMTWQAGLEGGGVLVGDEVDVEIAAALVRATDAEAVAVEPSASAAPAAKPGRQAAHPLTRAAERR